MAFSANAVVGVWPNTSPSATATPLGPGPLARDHPDLGVRDGVQVNAINPGFVRTDRMRGWLETEAAGYGGDIEFAAEQMVKRAHIVRMGEPEDIANLAAFILSQGRFLQGSLIDMDGGQTKTV